MALPYGGDLPKGVKTKCVVVTGFKDKKLSRAIFHDYLCQALAQGKYECASKPKAVGHYLESLQERLNQLKQGVSAKKLVDSIQTLCDVIQTKGCT